MVSSVAGLVLMTSAVTFASTSPSFSEQAGSPMMQDLFNGPQNTFNDFDGTGANHGRKMG
ncbi:MAG: hypothetical protein WCJ39_08910 [bacterium]